ncbi:MAG: flagellar biosynthetic protein FliR [SAR324 cluster bacterium]|nr:flagellar biosynthetic protein FliR [SAR324 cluster bacterium]
MPNLLSYNASELLAFIVVLLRITGIVMTAPILGDVAIPGRIKIAFSLAMTFLIHPFLPAIPVDVRAIHHFLILVTSELLIGLTLGMVGQIMFAAVSFAGELIGMQMGLSVANMFDPTTQQQSSLVAIYDKAIASLVFLMIDAHHVVIQAIVQSYQIIPPGKAGLSENLVEEFLKLSSSIFTIGFQIGAPLIVSLFLVNIILGLLNRSVPQFQLFVIGFPLTLLLGFGFMSVTMPFFIQTLRIFFERFDDYVLRVLHLL